MIITVRVEREYEETVNWGKPLPPKQRPKMKGKPFKLPNRPLYNTIDQEKAPNSLIAIEPK